jgi:methionyl-tRNA formyltransferase
LDVRAIVQEVGVSLDRSKFRRLLNRKRLVSKMSRWVRDRWRYLGKDETAAFFGSARAAFDRPDLVSRVTDINSAETLEIVDRVSPAVIAVFGTSILRPPLLTRGGIGILNLHGGLSPHYRGADCTFWALHNGQPDQVGCTIHFVNAGVDTGAIIAYVQPEVRTGDDELTLFTRGVRDSAEVYAQAIARLLQGEKLGQPQREKGHLYQVKDRTFAAERALARRFPGGLIDVSLPPRVRWFRCE